MAGAKRGAVVRRLAPLVLFILAGATAQADEQALLKALTRNQRKQIDQISAELGDGNVAAAQVQNRFRALVADIAARRSSLQRLEKIYGSRAAAADGLISYLSAPAAKGAARDASDRNALAKSLREFEQALRAERERIGDAVSPEAGVSSAWPLMVPDTLDRMKREIDRLHRRIERRRAGASTADAPLLGGYSFGRSLTTPQDALAFLQNLGAVQKRVALIVEQHQGASETSPERPEASKDLLAALRVDALDAFTSNRP